MPSRFRLQIWFSSTGEYGSGLSLGDTRTCPGSDAFNCKVPPHLTFDAAKGIAVRNRSQIVLGMTNLFDDEYAIAVDSALRGTRYRASSHVLPTPRLQSTLNVVERRTGCSHADSTGGALSNDADEFWQMNADEFGNRF